MAMKTRALYTVEQRRQYGTKSGGSWIRSTQKCCRLSQKPSFLKPFTSRFLAKFPNFTLVS